MADGSYGNCGLCGSNSELHCTIHVKSLNKEGLKHILDRPRSAEFKTIIDICLNCCENCYDPFVELTPKEFKIILREISIERKELWNEQKMNRARLFAKFLRFQLERF